MAFVIAFVGPILHKTPSLVQFALLTRYRKNNSRLGRPTGKQIDLYQTWIDVGPAAATLTTLMINFALIALFGVQHTVMARPEFNKKWTKFVHSFRLFARKETAVDYWDGESDEKD